jgi:small-conductance mechanosensitive channel
LLKEGDPEQLKSTFKRAKDTIDTAVNLVFQKLEAILKVQEKAGNINGKINALVAELNSLIAEEKRNALLNESPPLFSSQYFFQFKSGELWHVVKKNLNEITWPGNRFFAQQGWIVLIQVFLSLFVIIAVYRNREMLKESNRWRFLALRPIAAGIFLGFMMTVLIYEYEGYPAVWKLANTIIGGICFARLSGGFIEVSWKRQFVYGLMIVLIVTEIMDVIGFPLPLFRLYTVLTAVVGLNLCLRWARDSASNKELGVYGWLLRLGSLFFAFIIIAELWGKRLLASHLFASSIDTIATVLVFMLLMHMIHGGLQWLFNTSPLKQMPVLHGDTDTIVRRVGHIIDAAIWGLVVLPAFLMIWGLFESMQQATKGLLTLGFNIGSQRISVGLLIVSGGILYGSFLISWILQKLLMEEMLIRRRVERGVRLSMAKLIHYVLILAGFLLALSTLGFDVTKLTIMLSALGIGIGFGLQSIVNNFVSGLILLFERPVRVGDKIEIDGKWSEIKKIGLRATTVETFDQADLIIPNADLVNNQVTNWTLSSRQVRLIIPVGVAYGSDVPLVVETLMACAKANSLVAEMPEPQVLFLSFGGSSLDFELRAWVPDADDRLKVISQLHQEIDQRFRRAKIEIAFPQMDLHLRSLDEPVVFRHGETTG